MTYIEHNNPKDEVQEFCNQHNIDYSWDWNKENGSWNEIYFEGDLLMQITQGITLMQFLNVIEILSKNFYAVEFPDNGIEFTVCIKQNKKYEVLFEKFIEQNASVLFKS